MIIKKNKIKQWEENKSGMQAKYQPVNNAVSEKIEHEPISSVESFPEENDITPVEPALPPEPEIDLFDIENIDFNQRQERRRGTRRRGYRRIDDRNLVSRAQEEAEKQDDQGHDDHQHHQLGLSRQEGALQGILGQGEHRIRLAQGQLRLVAGQQQVDGV